MKPDRPVMEKDGRFKSPFAKWPGYIKFPETMTLPHYRMFVQRNDGKAEESEAEGTKLRALVRIIDDGDETDSHWVDLDRLSLVRAVVEEVKLENGDPFADDAPFRLTFWVIACLGVWLDDQMSFRLDGSSDMAPQAE